MSSWNIIVCGDLDSPVAICVPDPNKWALADLKVEVGKKVYQPVDEINLYCGETRYQRVWLLLNVMG